jgi:hypothetical protein
MLEVILINATEQWELKVQLNLCLTIPVILESSKQIDPEEIRIRANRFGAEEVFEDEDGILIYAPFGSFGTIQKN